MTVVCAALTPAKVSTAYTLCPDVFFDFNRVLSQTCLNDRHRIALYAKFEASYYQVWNILNDESIRQEVGAGPSLYSGALISAVSKMARIFQRVYVGSEHAKDFTSQERTERSDIKRRAIAFFAIFAQQLRLDDPLAQFRIEVE